MYDRCVQLLRERVKRAEVFGVTNAIPDFSVRSSVAFCQVHFFLICLMHLQHAIDEIGETFVAKNCERSTYLSRSDYTNVTIASMSSAIDLEVRH